MKKAIAIVLAAGKGTRMRSELPKVLTPVNGRPMVEYPLTALREGGIGKILVVVGYRGEEVRQALTHWSDLTFVWQTEQKGTGHAVQCCAECLREMVPDGEVPVVIVAGDAPMMQGQTIAALLEHWYAEPTAGLLGTIEVENPTGLGRILRDSDGNFLGIVEEKDTTPLQKTIREVNQSYYLFRVKDLLEVLPQLRSENAQGEYYLTDVPGFLLRKGRTVRALPLLQPIEATSVNTPEQRDQAELLLLEFQKRPH